MDIQPTPVRLGPAVRRTKRVSARWLSERKSTENEILQIHYDHVYYPADVFHLSVEWLLCSNLIVWRFVEVQRLGRHVSLPEKADMIPRKLS